MHPLNAFGPPQGVGEAIERVANDAIDSLDASIRQSLGHEICSSLAHWQVSTIAQENGPAQPKRSAGSVGARPAMMSLADDGRKKAVTRGAARTGGRGAAA
jgi:hypothetical protein